MEGYKVFKPNWTCRGFQYEVGKTYEMDEKPICCDRGFHFCKELKDCFSYYPFNPDNKVAKVIALGEIDEKSDDSKCCTNKIHIVEEVSWEDVLRMVNIGKGNSGLCNSGNCNSGSYNSGNCNSGDYNGGDYNSGSYNGGNHNSGNCNSGSYNGGNCNSGDYNSGSYNGGDYNSGNCNSGSYNGGNHNGGNCNSGDYNSGSYNGGNHNSGNCNSGSYNGGNCNSGDWNKTNFSNGCFNTEEPKIFLFNKPSDWTYRDWANSNARFLLNQIPDESGSQIWWDELDEKDKSIIKSIPNFDKEIFEDITGIKV